MPQIKLRSSSLQPNIHLGGKPTATETTASTPLVQPTESSSNTDTSTTQQSSSSNDVK
jgi:hypothetical protein